MHFKNKLKVQEVLKVKAQQQQKAALFSSAVWQIGRRAAVHRDIPIYSL